MARRMDSGWRDSVLADRHSDWGYEFPVTGMAFPMVEYDRGEPLAVISYIRRGQPLPTGPAVASAYIAFSTLHRETGEQLPFFTVQYDPRNWAYRVFGHNAAGKDFLADGSWVEMTEAQLVASLYRLRGRHAPDLAPYGVDIAVQPWLATEPSPDFAWPERWQHQLMSTRRRCFEPGIQVRPTWRNPCVDIDLAVVDQVDNVALIVDYKAPGAVVNVDSTNMKALSTIKSRRAGYSGSIAAMVARYEPGPDGWQFSVHCMNHTARMHLSYVLGADGSAETDQLARAIAGEPWVSLTESQWKDVLNVARDL